jgi:hypothetical protein
MKIVIIINIKDYKCEFMSEKIKREREKHITWDFLDFWHNSNFMSQKENVKLQFSCTNRKVICKRALNIMTIN